MLNLEDHRINVKLLVVDDEAKNIVAIKKLLASVDVEVFAAESGEEALKLMMHHDFAVVLLDVQMPIMDGYEVASIMKSNEELKLTPIIFLTAIYRDQAHVNLGYDVGAVDYLFKPIQPSTLLSKVRTFVTLKEYELKLKETSRNLRKTLESINDAIITVNDKCHIIYANKVALQMIGKQFDKLSGSYLFEHVSIVDKESVSLEHELLAKVEKSHSYTMPGEIKLINHLSSTYLVDVSIVPIDGGDETVGVVFTIHDVTITKTLLSKLEYQATHDALTGLPNRKLFLDRLEQALAAHKRLESKFAVLFIDIDNFKEINDSLGHQIGDALLISLSNALHNQTRESDTLARLGGDEFVIILNNCGSQVAIANMANAIIEIFNADYQIDESNLKVSGSIGISVYPDDTTKLGDLLRFADTAMYQAKKNGKNSYSFFDHEINVELQKKYALLNELRQSITGDHLELYAQPQYQLRQNKLIGAEILLRWKHPELGQMSPDFFIPIAEEAGMIHVIGNYVYQKLVDIIKSNLDVIPDDFNFCINVSPLEMIDSNFADSYLNQLVANKVNQYIALEITEGCLINNPDDVKTKLEKIRSEDISISLDDFGTGYCSLQYLNKLPIDVIKIDRSFVSLDATEISNKVIVRSIISLAQNMGINVLAEGVETQKQFDELIHYGCDYGQGYLMAKPMPVLEFIEQLKTMPAD